MLSYKTHPEEVKEIQNQIASGKFGSITFIKKNGDIRFMNVHKKFSDSTSPDSENRGKWDRLKYNILTVWDNNALNFKTGEKGDFRSLALDRLLFVKIGDFVRDYTDENIEAIKAANITPEQLNTIKEKMRINQTIQEEINNFIKKF